ncbi:MAG: 50S ribosomal protein L21 [Candidatus Omnitrophota bacterium]
MYVVVETGGKQYKVAKNETFLAEKMEAKAGETVTLDKVLLANDDDSVLVGTPYLEGSTVTCEVMGDVKLDKVIAFKYKRRKSEKKKIGHRSQMTELKVKEIKIAKK